MEYSTYKMLVLVLILGIRPGMTNSNPLAGLSSVVLTMKYTMRAALNKLDKLLLVFLIVITIEDQFKLPNKKLFLPTSSRF
jgi:hypothetical protein